MDKFKASSTSSNGNNQPNADETATPRISRQQQNGECNNGSSNNSKRSSRNRDVTAPEQVLLSTPSGDRESVSMIRVSTPLSESDVVLVQTSSEKDALTVQKSKDSSADAAHLEESVVSVHLGSGRSPPRRGSNLSRTLWRRLNCCCCIASKATERPSSDSASASGISKLQVEEDSLRSPQRTVGDECGPQPRCKMKSKSNEKGGGSKKKPGQYESGAKKSAERVNSRGGTGENSTTNGGHAHEAASSANGHHGEGGSALLLTVDDALHGIRRVSHVSDEEESDMESVCEESNGGGAGGGQLQESGSSEDLMTFLPGNKLLADAIPSYENKKCLVLDLDETLVHSSFKPVESADFTVVVEIDGIRHEVFVTKRPHLDYFLETVGRIFECVMFTASLRKYADPVCDEIDERSHLQHRLFREACVLFQGNYIKDLNRLGRDLDQIIIIDNSPISFLLQPQNAIQIVSWFDDPADQSLVDLLPYLTDLAKAPSAVDFLRDAVPPPQSAAILGLVVASSPANCGWFTPIPPTPPPLLFPPPPALSSDPVSQILSPGSDGSEPLRSVIVQFPHPGHAQQETSSLAH